MSLILEALRKSEAERRRGQTPDLLSDAMPAAPAMHTAPRNRNVIAIVAGAGLLAVLAVSWWLRSPTPLESDVVSKPPADRDFDASADTSMASMPSTPRLQPPASASRTAPLPAAVAPPSRIAMQPTTTAITSSPTSATTTAPAESKPAPQTASMPTSTSTPIEPAASASASAPATPAFTSPELPLKLSDLSTDDRQQLPPLKVSMHMWAPDAANRFAIIDGTRINEGDRIGDATVEAIQPDGVLLAWRGRHIHLPIR